MKSLFFRLKPWVFSGLIFFMGVLDAQALIIPKGSPTDKHIQEARYNPNEVYLVNTMQGYITTIQFGEDEKIISVNIGDSSSWLVSVQEQTVNLKPTANQPDTNLNVLTTRGTYQFFLTAPSLQPDATTGKLPRTPSDHTAFLLKFTYPESGLSGSGILTKKEKRVENWNYTARGNPAIVPMRVFDNGWFTFFDFGERQDIPAIFMVDGQGKESIVNYHMQGRYVVVEMVARQFTLRHGNQVATVFNEAS